MKNKKLMIGFAILFFSVILTTILATATVFPSYNNETDCRSCHGSDVSNRHHLLVVNGTRQCTDCHPVQFDNITQTYSTQMIRNCLICHPGKNHTNVHHILASQGLFVCSDCHPVVYDNVSQTYSTKVTWDCPACHSTVLSIQNSNPLPTPTPTPMPIPLTNVSITNFTPISPINNFVGESRNFHVIIDQIADVAWYINGTQVQFDGGVNDSSYTNTSATLGIWNVSATATNTHGNVTYTWEWIVITPPPPPVAPKINSYFPLFSPVNNSVGSSRKFGISIDQNVDIQWLINGKQVQFNESINGSSYNNTSAVSGTWNVSALVSNINGTDIHSWVWNVYPSPIIIGSTPLSPVNDISGESRTFNITTDQIVNVTWFINGTPVQSNENINNASYTNTSATLGKWNVTASAINANGSVSYSWIWNVISSDNTPPQIIINSPVDGKIYIINQNLIANWSASDISGIATATGTYPNGSTIITSSTGTMNFGVYAIDNVGNINTKNVTYYIRYNFGNFLSPIKNDGSSIFKLGNTIPIKFQLTDNNGNYITNAVARLNISKISSSILGKNLDYTSVNPSTTGYNFIYDNNGHMYMYNLATKNMSSGTWKIRVDIDDGSVYTVNISLKR